MNNLKQHLAARQIAAAAFEKAKKENNFAAQKVAFKEMHELDQKSFTLSDDQLDVIRLLLGESLVTSENPLNKREYKLGVNRLVYLDNTQTTVRSGFRPRSTNTKRT